MILLSIQYIRTGFVVTNVSGPRDKNQDIYARLEDNCAEIFSGGWWYKNCYHAHPTGFSNAVKTSNNKCIMWNDDGDRGRDVTDWQYGTKSYNWKETEYKLVLPGAFAIPFGET